MKTCETEFKECLIKFGVNEKMQILPYKQSATD